LLVGHEIPQGEERVFLWLGPQLTLSWFACGTVKIETGKIKIVAGRTQYKICRACREDDPQARKSNTAG
jgi:hypothetical protein